MSLSNPSIPPALATYASRLRAEFSVDRATDELLLDELVTAALRLKALHSDPRALDPLGQPAWGREHEKTSRAYHRNLRALLLAQRRPSGPRPRYTPTPLESSKPPTTDPTPAKAAPPSATPSPTAPSTPPNTNTNTNTNANANANANTSPRINPTSPATIPPPLAVSPQITTDPAPSISRPNPSPFDRPRRPDPRQALAAHRRASSKPNAHGRESPRP